jgi:HEAT repeat protein
VALLALGCSKAPPPYEGKSVAELQALLADPDPGQRAVAAHGLSRHGPAARDAVPQLARLLGDPDAQVRVGAATALAAVGPEAVAAVPQLTSALGAGEAGLRRQAALALGKIGPGARAALPALEKLRRDETHIVRQAAEEAVRSIRRTAGG